MNIPFIGKRSIHFVSLFIKNVLDIIIYNLSLLAVNTSSFPFNYFTLFGDPNI